jgi:hypothetical protein
MRLDFLFSYWIFFWYILYISGLTHFNPKFALIIAIIHNVCLLIMMIYLKVSEEFIIKFVILMFLIKLIPLYTINNKIKTSDITVTFILLLVYIVWMLLNGKDLDYLFLSTKKIVNGKFIVPGMEYF